MVTITDFRLKIVVEFDIGNTLAQVTSFFNNTVKPDLATIITTKLDANFDPGYTLDHTVLIHEKVAGTFQIYPRLIFSGTTTLTKAQLRSGLDTTLTDLKGEMATHLSAQGATNVSYHVHRSTGSVEET